MATFLILSYFLFLIFKILVNSAYCCLILLGKAIQKLVFGELRVSEEQVYMYRQILNSSDIIVKSLICNLEFD